MPQGSSDRDRSRGALILFCLLSLPLFGQDAASVALLVTETNLDSLGPALKSKDALTRAAAARVALVRGVVELVPSLREALAAEKDASAAREQMRAIVILGTDDDVAFAASQLSRFPASIDGDFSEAIARIGAPRATALYLKHVAGSREPAPALALALWGRSSLATAVASRLLAAKDEAALKVLLREAAKDRLVLDEGVLLTALDSQSNEIISDAIWYLVRAYAADPAKLPEKVRTPATAAREGAPLPEAFGREVLRRMLGAEPVTRDEWLESFRAKKHRPAFADRNLFDRFLTRAEKTALGDKEDDDVTIRRPATHSSQTVSDPDFRLPILLPAGLADSILKKTRCSDFWIGVVKASVDRAGRVQTLDVGNVGATPGCTKALDAMTRLSLAEPVRLTSPLETANLLVLKPPGGKHCFDEDRVTDRVARRGIQPVGGEITAPKIKKRVEPRFPASVREEMQGGSVLVMAEAVITRSGCVRDVRLLRQSRWPALNAAAVLALSEWTFTPGELDGVPVDVVFNLTINFKTN